MFVAFHYGDFSEPRDTYGDGTIQIAAQNGRIYANTPPVNLPAWFGTFTATTTSNTETTSYTTYTWTPNNSGLVDVLIVAGGGGGGTGVSGSIIGGGGGGAGGLIYTRANVVSNVSIDIIVGAGGAGSVVSTELRGEKGQDSTFGTLTAVGGGGGGRRLGEQQGGSGGSGGGGVYRQSGGSGVEGQGFAGGDSDSIYNAPSGGGGAGARGGDGNLDNSVDGSGGVGLEFKKFIMYGDDGYFSGGGGPGIGINDHSTSRFDGGKGGGGNGSDGSDVNDGLPHTGGGGGGGPSSRVEQPQKGGDGGSGIVIVHILSVTFDDTEFSSITAGTQISSWNNCPALSTGGSTLPVVKKDEMYSYVRFGTEDSSPTKGNYISLGTRTWMLQNGFTAIGVIRFWAVKKFQRWFDLGNDTEKIHIFWAKENIANARTVWSIPPKIDNRHFDKATVGNGWHIVVARSSASPLPVYPDIILDANEFLGAMDNSTIPSWGRNTAVSVGGSALPVVRTDEAFPYVRLGSSDASTTKGNYIDLGERTWNLQNGFTAVGVIRFYERKNWQRWFDFANKAAEKNILWANSTGSTAIWEVWNNTAIAIRLSVSNGVPLNQWLVVVARIPSTVDSLETWVNPSTELLPKYSNTGIITQSLTRTLSNNWIGRSNWSVDSYACLDIRESHFYNRALTDAELQDTITYLNTKYNILPSEPQTLEHWVNPNDLLEPRYSSSTTSTLTAQTLTNNWIGRPNTSEHSYSCIDIREMSFYDYALTDSEILDIVTNIRTKYNNDPQLDPSPDYTSNGEMLNNILRGIEGAVENPRFTDNKTVAERLNIPSLYARYTADSWSTSENRWLDVSGNNRHTQTIDTRGTIRVGTSTDPSGRTVKCLMGDIDAGVKFPSSVLPSTFTLFHLARYTGGRQGRIFDGITTNWLDGFLGSSKKGVAYHRVWITDNISLPDPTNWLVSASQKNVYRAYGVDRSNGATTGTSAHISINYGDFTDQRSDWAVAEVIVYDRELSDAEMVQIEQYLLAADYPKNVYDHGWNIAEGWEVSASTVTNVFTPAFKAFNKTATDSQDCWLSDDTLPTTQQWLQIKYPQAVSVGSYSITSRNDSTNTWFPTKWRIQGYSQYTLSWDNLEPDRTTGSEGWGPGVTKTFRLTPSTTKYTYFRLLIDTAKQSNTDSGDTFVAIGNWSLLTEPITTILETSDTFAGGYDNNIFNSITDGSLSINTIHSSVDYKVNENPRFENNEMIIDSDYEEQFGSVLADPVVIYASSTKTSFEPWKAFNKTVTDSNDAWIGEGTVPSVSNAYWLEIQYPVPVNVKSYAITSRNSSITRFLTEWVLQGSNDRTEETSWTALEDVRTETSWGEGQTKMYFDNVNVSDTMYTNFRLYITGSSQTSANAFEPAVGGWYLYTRYLPLPPIIAFKFGNDDGSEGVFANLEPDEIDTRYPPEVFGTIRIVNNGINEVEYNWNPPMDTLLTDVLVVAGGGGGGGVIGGGGGAGGLIFNSNYLLGGNTTIIVGNGGTGGTGWNTSNQDGKPGFNSQFADITANGGGGGRHHGGGTTSTTIDGGSGGGGAQGGGDGGTGITDQGNNGGDGGNGNFGAGGGGAGEVGKSPIGSSGGEGGKGKLYSSIYGTCTYFGDDGYFAGGGGGGVRYGSSRIAGTGGSGGGGNGTATTVRADDGMPHTGGGGGGGGYNSSSTAQIGGNGGSGIVLVRARLPPMSMTFSEALDTYGTEGLIGQFFTGNWRGIISTGNIGTLPLPSPTIYTSIQYPSRGDSYGFIAIGYFNPPVTGTYTIYTSSDDGSGVWIGNIAAAKNGRTTTNAVVNNNMGFGQATASAFGTINLTAGIWYPIRIVHEEVGGGDNLTFSWKGPGMNETIIDLSTHFRCPVNRHGQRISTFWMN